MTVRFEVATTPARLQEIQSFWDTLWRRGASSVFQSHGWIMAWWNARDTDDTARLHIGLCWSAEALVAVFPCAIRLRRRVRVLEWAAKDCSDYCDVLLDRSHPESASVLQACWHAMDQAGGFDAVYLSHVRPDAIVQPLLSGARVKASSFRPSHRSEQTLQVLSNGLTGDQWFRGLPKKARNNHTRGKRIVSESGPVAVTVHDPASGDHDAILERMITLKQGWLQSTGRSSAVLEHDGRILRSLVAELHRQNALRVFSMTCAGQLVAASVNIAQGQHMAAFFAAYDSRFDRASPGTLIMVEYLMWAFDHHVGAVDFLCGDEEYKFKFANHQTELAAYVGSRTLWGRAALMVGERLDQSRMARSRPMVAELHAS